MHVVKFNITFIKKKEKYSNKHKKFFGLFKKCYSIIIVATYKKYKNFKKIKLLLILLLLSLFS